VDDFSQVKGYCWVWDQDTVKELCRYNFSDDKEASDSVEVGKISRDGSEWKFTAIGNGKNGKREGFIKKYAYRF
jgi:stress response protein SCP2